MCKMKFSNSVYRWLCQTHDQEKGDKDGCLIGAREAMSEARAAINGAIEICGNIGNLEHAKRLLNSALGNSDETSVTTSGDNPVNRSEIYRQQNEAAEAWLKRIVK